MRFVYAVMAAILTLGMALGASAAEVRSPTNKAINLSGGSGPLPVGAVETTADRIVVAQRRRRGARRGRGGVRRGRGVRRGMRRGRGARRGRGVRRWNRGRRRANRRSRRRRRIGTGVAIGLGILGALALSQSARADRYSRRCRRWLDYCDGGERWACRRFRQRC